MIARMGRPREKHKSLPPGFRFAAGRWYWRPTDEASRRAAAGRNSIPTGETSVDGARRWWVHNILPKLDASAPTAGPGATVGDVLNLYQTTGMTHLRQRTADGYRALIPDLQERFGTLRYAKTQSLAEAGEFIRAHHVQHWLRSFKNQRGETAVKRKIAVLSSAFNCAIEAGWTVYNPCLDVAGRSVRAKRERYVTDAELSAVHTTGNPVVKLILEWIYKTAQRYEDILRFGPDDEVTIDGRPYLLNPNAKTGQQIYILIDDELRALIERAVATHNKRPRKVVSIKVTPQSRRTTYFCTRDGQPYTPSGVASQFDRARAKAGVSDFALRDLRGKAATDMAAAGKPLGDIQTLLGHASITTTEIYIRQFAPAIANTGTAASAPARPLWRAA